MSHKRPFSGQFINPQIKRNKKRILVSNLMVKRMIMRISFGIALLFILLALGFEPKKFVVFSQSKEFGLNSSKRDLSLYEQSKTYDFRWGKATLRAEREEFREFLWQQWLKQRRTKVTAKFYSKEGDPTISTYYIEPTEIGYWRIVVESESECCWFYAMQTPKKQRVVKKSIAVFNGIERVQEVKDRNGLFLKWKAVPVDKQLTPQSYWLRFKNGAEASTNVF